MIEAGATRGIGFLSGVASVAAVTLLLFSPWKDQIAVPGGLTSNHAALLDDCGACHAESNDAVQGLHHGWGVTELDRRQTALCNECHAFEHATNPHGWGELVAGAAPSALPGGGLERVECATCHVEHGSRDNVLTALDDTRCQVCHAERFASFADHPAFTSYPQRRKTNVGFDHVAHLERYFLESESGAPDACTSCHQLDDAGRHMPVVGYDVSCASCHDEDVLGPGQVEGAGLAVLSLPALDTFTLQEREVGIGRWTADSMITEAPLTPFLAQLLAGDATVARDLETLRSLDLLDLADATDQELEAVARVAWAIKELFAELGRDGHAAVLARLGLADPPGFATRRSRGTDLLHRLPEDLVEHVTRAWLPGLEDELERRANGETIETDATPPDEEPDLAIDERHERWVATGGWFLSELDFVVRYRPSGHADAFLRAWIDHAGERHASEPDLWEELTRPDAVGRCGKCHADLPTEQGGRALAWTETPPSNGDRGLERFSHVAHFASASDNACLSCHVLAQDTPDFLANFLEPDPTVWTPSFDAIDKESCASCHFETGADASCLTCHVYHSRDETSRVPGASLRSLLERR